MTMTMRMPTQPPSVEVADQARELADQLLRLQAELSRAGAGNPTLRALSYRFADAAQHCRFAADELDPQTPATRQYRAPRPT